MCTYIIFYACRYIALTTLSKFVQVVQKRLGMNKYVCTKSHIYEVTFQNVFGAVVHLRDCSCAPILRFFYAALDVATAERQIQNRSFWSIFFTSLRKDSVANHASIWTLFYRLLGEQMCFATH